MRDDAMMIRTSVKKCMLMDLIHQVLKQPECMLMDLIHQKTIV